MAFPDDWSYRKSITLSRASGAVTNYQMKLLVGESSGAAGENVDCGGLCKTDFSDLRFTAADGTTLLDYWIETVSGTTPNQLATVWIEFDSIGTGATTFYMYYGNAAATAVSSGVNTFLLFEDFEWGSNGDNLNTSGGSVAWTAAQGTAVISTEQKFGGTRSAKFGGAATYPIVTAAYSLADNIAIAIRFYKETLTENAPNLFLSDGTEVASVYVLATEALQANNGAIGASCSADTWQKLEIRDINKSGNVFKVSLNDGAAIATNCVLTSTAANFLRLLNATTISGRDAWVDNVIVRHQRITEPAWGSWGTQEDLGGAVMNSQFFVMLLAGGGR